MPPPPLQPSQTARRGCWKVMVPPVARRQMRHADAVPFTASGAADLSSCGSVKPGLCVGVEEERARGACGAVTLTKPSPDPWQLPARWVSQGWECTATFQGVTLVCDSGLSSESEWQGSPCLFSHLSGQGSCSSKLLSNAV